jgi:hypothetical protein
MTLRLSIVKLAEELTSKMTSRVCGGSVSLTVDAAIRLT